MAAILKMALRKKSAELTMMHLEYVRGYGKEWLCQVWFGYNFFHRCYVKMHNIPLLLIIFSFIFWHWIFLSEKQNKLEDFLSENKKIVGYISYIHVDIT